MTAEIAAGNPPQVQNLDSLFPPAENQPYPPMPKNNCFFKKR